MRWWSIMLKSVKSRVSASVLVAIGLLIAALPFVVNKAEAEITNAFEQQAENEQARLFLQLLSRHQEELSSWMRPWFTPENLDAIHREAPDLKAWEARLLGIGNQISAAFGVEHMIAYNAEGAPIFHNRTGPKVSQLTPDNAGVQALLARSLSSEGITKGTLLSQQGAPLFALIVPAEDEDGEIASYHALVGNMESVVKAFSRSTHYTTQLRVGAHITSLPDTPNLPDALTHTIIKKNGRELWMRKVSLPEELYPNAAHLNVWVDVSSLHASTQMMRNKMHIFIATIALAIIPAIFFILGWLLRPLRKIERVANRLGVGDYEARVGMVSGSEMQKLAEAFNQMATSIQTRDRDLRALLDGLSEGLVQFDLNGELSAERSGALAQMLPQSVQCKTLMELTSLLGDEDGECAEFVLESLREGDLVTPLEDLLSMLPRAVARTTQRIQHLRIRYQPLLDARGDIQAILMFVSDVTEQLESEAKQKEEIARVDRISMAASNPESFKVFLEEACNLVDALDEASAEHPPEDMVLFKRQLHTLKGNWYTYHFTSLGEQVHALETELSQATSQGTLQSAWERIYDHLNDIKALWETQHQDLRSSLSLDASDIYMRVHRGKLQKTQKSLLASGDPLQAALALSLQQFPLSEVLLPFSKLVERVARRQSKRIELRFTEGSAEVARAEIQVIEGALGHLFRNAVDHGLESPQEREALGKPAVGRLTVAGERASDGGLRLCIADDGHGIDVERLKAKAVQAGHWSEACASSASRQEALELIFAPLSTKDEITDLSGRGVGMGAVRSIIEDLGGSLTLQSAPGEGTTFEMSLPRLPTTRGPTADLRACA